MYERQDVRRRHAGGGTACLMMTTRQAKGWIMADSGLFIGFGTPVRGRERQAIKAFSETFEYYSRLQQEGEIESFEPVILEPHGGQLGGFFLVRGDQDKLARIRGSEEPGTAEPRVPVIAGGGAWRALGFLILFILASERPAYGQEERAGSLPDDPWQMT